MGLFNIDIKLVNYNLFSIVHLLKYDALFLKYKIMNPIIPQNVAFYHQNVYTKHMIPLPHYIMLKISYNIYFSFAHSFIWIELNKRLFAFDLILENFKKHNDKMTDQQTNLSL